MSQIALPSRSRSEPSAARECMAVYCADCWSGESLKGKQINVYWAVKALPHRAITCWQIGFRTPASNTLSKTLSDFLCSLPVLKALNSLWGFFCVSAVNRSGWYIFLQAAVHMFGIKMFFFILYCDICHSCPQRHQQTKHLYSNVYLFCVSYETQKNLRSVTMTPPSHLHP